jgi:hypothetical protein
MPQTFDEVWKEFEAAKRGIREHFSKRRKGTQQKRKKQEE